jgi:hypothetical protein
MRARFVVGVVLEMLVVASSACTGHSTRALQIRSAAGALVEARVGGAWAETRGEATIVTPGALRTTRTTSLELVMMQHAAPVVLAHADVELDGNVCEVSVEPACEPGGACYAEVTRDRSGTCVLRISATDVDGHEIDRCWASVVYESDEHQATAQAEGELDRALRECRFGE